MMTRKGAANGTSTEPSLIVLANRAPFSHQRSADGTVKRVRSASGLVTAIEPIVEALSGTWIAHGERPDLQAADRAQRVAVRQGGRCYHVRYVPIAADEYDGFYGGFANEGLWPLCHEAGVAPAFRDPDFRSYRSANRRFAAAVVEEAAGTSPYVLVQDYHFALAPRLIRRALPASPIVSFWHIPWPEPEAFARCAWSEDLILGLLGSDVMGLQTEKDCERFLESAALFECDVDFARRVVHRGGRSTAVRAYPVGVQVDACALLATPKPAECRDAVIGEYGLARDSQLVVGVDRLDYSKGIPEKLRAIEWLLDQRPDMRGRFTLIQVAEPSRASLTAYREVRATVLELAARLNERFGNAGWQPVRLVDRHLDAAAVYRLYRAADVCFVNSYADGMNLVAKEFVAARSDERGVLLLSEHAGAIHQLRSALPVSPRRIDDAARQLAVALEMSVGEQRRRMRAMRAAVAASDCYWWADQLTSAVAAPVAQPLYWASEATSLRFTTF
jgi:trehalose 6-phosphate synthase